MLARLRSGTNCLRIETGRYEGRREYERICKLCAEEIEDEEHFLCKCTAYNSIRKEFLEELDMDEYDDADILKIML